MEKFPKMVDLAMTAEEMLKNSMPGSLDDQSVYPYGTTLCLGNEILDKLNVDHTEWEVGDIFHLACMAKVSSKNENDTGAGPKNRIELQIIALGAESEDAENDETPRRAPRIPYKRG